MRVPVEGCECGMWDLDADGNVGCRCRMQKEDAGSRWMQMQVQMRDEGEDGGCGMPIQIEDAGAV